jgi:transposase, IS5 family
MNIPRQFSFVDSEFDSRKPTRRGQFLAKMEQVVPWQRLRAVVEPHYRDPASGRRRLDLEMMLRIHLMQIWFGYGDLAMEEALLEVHVLRRFAGITSVQGAPDETTICKFRHLLEQHGLSEGIFTAVNEYLSSEGLVVRRGTIVDATIISAPTSTKNSKGERDPEMHQTKKGNQWYHGMKAHVGVDLESGLVHTVTVTSANVSDVTETPKLLHGQESVVFADAGYVGAAKREVLKDVKVDWQIAARRSTVEKLPEAVREIVRESERIKAMLRAKVEHVFQVLKCVFGYRKVKYRGMTKNGAHMARMMAMVNLHKAANALVG